MEDVDELLDSMLLQIARSLGSDGLRQAVEYVSDAVITPVDEAGDGDGNVDGDGEQSRPAAGEGSAAGPNDAGMGFGHAMRPMSTSSGLRHSDSSAMECVLLQVLKDMQRGSEQLPEGGWAYAPDSVAPPSIRAIKYRVSAQLSSSVVPGMREHVLESMVERLQ